MESLTALVKNLKTRRKQAGITQEELAEAADVSQSYIAKVESGFINPSYAYLDRIQQALEEQEANSKPAVKTVMNPEIISVQPGQTVETVVETMKQHAYSQLPVIQNGNCIGSITEAHLLTAMSEDGNLKNQQISDIMDDPFPILGAEANIRDAASLLQNHAAVLVSDQDGLAGIITKTDLL